MSGAEPPPPAPFPEGRGGDSGVASPASADVEEARRASFPLPSGRGGGLRRAHLPVLLLLLCLWTWKLLEPQPVPEALSAKLKGETRLVAAKSLHACGYFTLTLLAVTLPVPNRWRWFFAALLALHGVATEIGQTYVPGRVGSVRDVLIDWAGAALGVVVWRLWARR